MIHGDSSGVIHAPYYTYYTTTYNSGVVRSVIRITRITLVTVINGDSSSVIPFPVPPRGTMESKRRGGVGRAFAAARVTRMMGVTLPHRRRRGRKS